MHFTKKTVSEKRSDLIKNLKTKMNVINKTGGSLLLITGVLMITNQLQALGYYLLEYIPFMQNLG